MGSFLAIKFYLSWKKKLLLDIFIEPNTGEITNEHFTDEGNGGLPDNLPGNQLNAPAEVVFPDRQHFVVVFPNDSISAVLFSTDSTENAASSYNLDSAASHNVISTENSEYSTSSCKKMLHSEQIILFF